MKKEVQKETKPISEEVSDKNISRKEAIKKTGYVALSAATMMLLLSSPAKGNTTSPASIPEW